ncbi:MAG: translation initiation factor IF-2 [Planctomycetota bacterium]|nr:translation initiation factor IF-2 [Planctomycetota bacterium]
MAKRFYHIAFELGMKPREFMNELSEVGLSVGNQMVIIPPELEARIHEVFDKLSGNVPEVEEEPAADEAVVAEAGAPGVGAQEVVSSDDTTAVEAVPAAGTDDDAGSRAVETPAPVAPAKAEAQPDAATRRPQGKRIDPATSRKPAPLVPTIDPRAGRLVKDAPVGGVSHLQPRPRRTGEARTPNDPSLPQSDRAPGERRDGHRRVSERYRGKRGKETFQMRRSGQRRSRAPTPVQRPSEVTVELPITVKGLGEITASKAAGIIKVLFQSHGMMVTPNSVLDKETVELICLELEIDLTFKAKQTVEDTLLKQFDEGDDDGELQQRPPIVTILGHVDHGKTTLLDYIRKSDVAGREAGGITQHIGASMVTLADGRKVTFLDTPGHEAFTEMRARGAQVTDIVILIVAADDGVMPQTVEAISHAKAAGVQMVVAITKVDKDNARATRARQQLSEHGVYVEGYGGDVSVFEVSGITGQGVPEMLDHIALMAQIDSEKFRANPDRRAMGTVVEAQNSPQRGILATVLVQNGTLKKGDAVLAGEAWGKVRGLFDDKGDALREAGPSTPVEIIGLDRVPDVGTKFYAARNAIEAKKIVEQRRVRSREMEVAAQSKPTSVDALFGKIQESKTNELNLVVKADVKGSLDPLKTILERLGNDEVRPRIIHSNVGGVNESDVVLASASNALVIGFHVNVDAMARARAKQDHVDVRLYKVIYEIEDDVRDLLEGRLAPEMFESAQGAAEVRAIFTFSKIGNIAGCRVTDGIIRRDSLVRIRRGEEIVHEGKVGTLRREKDQAQEVRDGLECGITIDGWDAFQEGDIIEAYKIEAKRRTLSEVTGGA